MKNLILFFVTLASLSANAYTVCTRSEAGGHMLIFMSADLCYGDGPCRLTPPPGPGGRDNLQCFYDQTLAQAEHFTLVPKAHPLRLDVYRWLRDQRTLETTFKTVFKRTEYYSADEMQSEEPHAVTPTSQMPVDELSQEEILNIK